MKQRCLKGRGKGKPENHSMKTIVVRVTPKASSNRIGEAQTLLTGEEYFTVHVTAAPENGKANEAVVRLLADYFDVAPSRVRVIKGLTHRTKVVRID